MDPLRCVFRAIQPIAPDILLLYFTWNLKSRIAHSSEYTFMLNVLLDIEIDRMLILWMCGRRYLEPATGVATKVGTGRPSGHPRPPGDGGDSCRRRLGYEEPDAGQA